VPVVDVPVEPVLLLDEPVSPLDPVAPDPGT
jgi:ABC-type phosphate transport system ATPase subunit